MIGELNAVVVPAARWIAASAGVYLIGVSLFMMTSPQGALAALAKMAGTGLVHYGEISLRALAGVGLWLAAASSRFPDVLLPAGLFLVASSVALLLVPRRWHAAYSVWWARRIPAAAVRPFALLSLGAGAALVWAVL